MTDGLRKSHLRKAHQVGLSEVGLPEGNLFLCTSLICISSFSGSESCLATTFLASLTVIARRYIVKTTAQNRKSGKM